MNYAYMAKAIATAIGTGLTAAISYYPHAGWIPIAAAICTAMAVYAIPNSPKKVPENGSPVPGNLPAQNREATDTAPVLGGESLLPGMTETVQNFYERVNA